MVMIDPTTLPPVPLAGTAPLAPNAFQIYPPNVLGGKGPVRNVPYTDQMASDVTGYGVPKGALDPNFYDAETSSSAALDNTTLPGGALAGTPKDSGIFSFLNKPGASDSLVAFGSAMLRAPNFNEGLANAANAVNKVAQQYRPIPDVQLENLKRQAMAQAEVRNILNPPKPEPPPQDTVHENRPIYGNLPGNGQRELFYPVTRADGSFGFLQASTNQIVPSIENALRPEDDVAKYNSKNAADAQKEARGIATDASKRIGQTNDLLSLYDSGGAGPSGWDKASREFSRLFETDVLGVDPADTQRIETILADMELAQAQTQRGLGQLTEAERDIIRRSIPNINQSRDAFVSTVFAMKRQSERAKMIYRNWSTDKNLQAEYPNIEDYYISWMDSPEAEAFDAETKTKLNALLTKAPKGAAAGGNSGQTSTGLKWSVEP